MVFVFVEAVPAVLSATGDEIDPESGKEEDLPVIFLKLDKVWDLDGEDQAVQAAAMSDEASRSKSTSEESVAVDATEAGDDLVPDAPSTDVHYSSPGFMKLVQKVVPQKPIDFSGILLSPHNHIVDYKVACRI